MLRVVILLRADHVLTVVGKDGKLARLLRCDEDALVCLRPVLAILVDLCQGEASTEVELLLFCLKDVQLSLVCLDRL